MEPKPPFPILQTPQTHRTRLTWMHSTRSRYRQEAGKTALVNSVLEELEAEVHVIIVNCMALNNVDELWNRLLEELQVESKAGKGRGKKSPSKAKGRDAVLKALTQLKTQW